MSSRLTRRHSAVITIMLICAASAAAVQKPVDFSGEWIPVAPPRSPGEVRETLVVVQDKSGMTATFGAEGRKETEEIRYEFDGIKTQSRMSPAGPIEATVTSAWKGASLVATSTIKARERTRSFEQVWALDASGRLTITTTSQSGKPRTAVYTRRPQ